MPDVREVFQMSTQKVRPDPGFVDRQHDHQHRRQRNRKIGAFVAVGAIGLAAVVVILATRPDVDQSTPVDRPETTTPSPLMPGVGSFVDVASGTATSVPASMSGAATYVVSPDGTKIAFNTCCTTQDVVKIGNVDGSDVHAVTPTEGLDAYGPAWSPDGTELVYQLRNAVTMKLGSLVLQDVASGEETVLATLEGADNWWFLSPSFSPDGQNVIFQQARVASPGWDVWTVPATGGEPTLLLRDAGWPRYLPGGSEIVYVSGMTRDLSGDRLILTAADGTRRTLARGEVGAPSVSPDGSRVAYVDGAQIEVVDVATGEAVALGYGGSAEWLDDDTLIVAW